jgi:hypothetical protein
MHRLAADLVVGMEERLGQEIADVGSAQAIDDPTTVAATLDEASKAELREMLAGHSCTTAGRLGQRRNVSFTLAERPQQPHTGWIGQKCKGHHRSLHASGVKDIGVWRSGGARTGSDRDHAPSYRQLHIFTYAQMSYSEGISLNLPMP